MLIRFEKIHLNFMSVCFKSFDVSHGFSKTALSFRITWFGPIINIYQSMYDLNQFVFEKIKRVNDEE